MDKYDESELIGRPKAIKAIQNMDGNLIIRTTPIEKKKSYDLYFISADTLMIVECKDRDCTTKRYNTLMLSKDKYDFLTHLDDPKTEWAKRYLDEGKVEAWYVNTFTDRKCYIWDVNKSDVEEGWSTHNKSTVYPENGKKTERAVYFNKQDMKYILEF